MKTYSDDAVIKADLKEIDVTQTKDIARVRMYVIAGFVINLLISGAIYFLK